MESDIQEWTKFMLRIHYEDNRKRRKIVMKKREILKKKCQNENKWKRRRCHIIHL